MPTIVKYAGPFKSLDFFKHSVSSATTEIAKVIEIKAQESFEKQKVKGGRSTGALISNFRLIPTIQEGNKVFKAIVFCGGPSAPYAPIVESVGWKTNAGRKSSYFFMKEGAEKGREVSGEITIKHLSKVV